MAGLSELNSFVGKFLNLWQSGFDASLHLKTCDGKATVNLQVGLGKAPSPPPTPHRRVPGPSRQRRSMRRAMARKSAEEAVADEQAKKDAEEAVSLDAKKAQPAEEAAVALQVAAANAEDVNDEVCPDDQYKVVEIEQTAFRCFQCRMLFLPAAHIDGNKIENYESCRRHIGIAKCQSCAIVLVGLAKIRCHRQVCPHSA